MTIVKFDRTTSSYVAQSPVMITWATRKHPKKDTELCKMLIACRLQFSSRHYFWPVIFQEFCNDKTRVETLPFPNMSSLCLVNIQCIPPWSQRVFCDKQIWLKHYIPFTYFGETFEWGSTVETHTVFFSMSKCIASLHWYSSDILVLYTIW